MRSNSISRQYIAEEEEENEGYARDAKEFDDLLASGIDENDIEDIFSFARHGRIEEIEKLLHKGVPVDVRDQYGNTLLITACQNGNKRVAKAVLRRGADINSRNFKGNTPLHYCYHCKLIGGMVGVFPLFYFVCY
jgi:ankyrin repeat protein